MKIPLFQQLNLWLVFYWQWKKRKLIYWSIFLLIVLIIANFMQFRTAGPVSITVDEQYMIFLSTLVPFVLVAVYELTRDWLKGPESVFKNLLPFSNGIHIAGIVLSSAILMPLLFISIFYLVEIPFLWITNNFLEYLGRPNMNSPLLNPFINFNQSDALLNYPLLTLLVLEIYLLVFVFGMLSFRKFVFFTASLFTFVIFLISDQIFEWSRWFLVPKGWIPSWSTWSHWEGGQEIQRLELGVWYHVLIYVIVAATFILLSMAIYHRFREKNVLI